MTKQKRTVRGSADDLFSISGASVALSRSRRLIAKAMLGEKPDAVRSGLKLWKMARIIANVNSRTQAPLTERGDSVAPQSSTVSYDLARSRAELAQAQTRKATIEAGVLAGKYWKADLVIKAREAELIVMRERLLAIPGTCADQLTPFTPQDRVAIELILRDVLYEAMEVISNPDFMLDATRKRRGIAPPVEAKAEATPT
jgi:hypothetical protein